MNDNGEAIQEIEVADEIINETIEAPREKHRDYFLPVSILLAGLMISGSIVYLVRSNHPGSGPTGAANNNNPAAPGANGAVAANNIMKIGNRDVILGDPNAPVTLIEYGDYQCPFCGRFFSQTEPLLRDNYIKTNKVRMVFRGFQFLGPESIAAGAAAECAKDQSKFWAYHDALYAAEVADGRENSGNLTRDLFVKLAGDVGLDTKSFADCVDSKKYDQTVMKDAADAQAMGVVSTPTIYINGQQFLGALPYAQFSAAIDSALKS